MEPLAKRNIETIIDLATPKKDKTEAKAKIVRYINMLDGNHESYTEYAKEYMKKKWRE